VQEWHQLSVAQAQNEDARLSHDFVVRTSGLQSNHACLCHLDVVAAARVPSMWLQANSLKRTVAPLGLSDMRPGHLVQVILKVGERQTDDVLLCCHLFGDDKSIRCMTMQDSHLLDLRCH